MPTASEARRRRGTCAERAVTGSGPANRRQIQSGDYCQPRSKSGSGWRAGVWGARLWSRWPTQRPPAPRTPMLLAIILGPLMEEYLRRAVTVGDFNADGL